MSLTFTAHGQRAFIGRGPLLDNLDPWTVAVWFYPTAAVPFTYLAGKGGPADAGVKRLQLASAAGGQLALAGRQAHSGANALYETAVAVTPGQWQFIAAVYHSGAPAGQRFRFYHGGLAAPAALLSLSGAGEPSGALNPDSSRDWFAGSGFEASASPAPGHYAWLSLWAAPLSLAQLRAQQVQPATVIAPDNCRFHAPFDNPVTLADGSGHGHHAAVQGSPAAGPTLPLLAAGPPAASRTAVHAALSL